jgi:flagellar assembly factor FliW
VSGWSEYYLLLKLSRRVPFLVAVGAEDMLQVPLAQNPTNLLESVMPISIDAPEQDRSRVVYAANDAQNLVHALSTNLEWIAETLASTTFGGDVGGTLQDAVAVCQNLTQLLGGAVVSCREATRPKSDQKTAPFPIHQAVIEVMSRLSKEADRMGVLLVNEGATDLLVSADDATMVQSLEVLVTYAIHDVKSNGVVRMSHTRCGAYAVLAVSSLGANLTDSQLLEVDSFGSFGRIDEPKPHELKSVFTELSLTLADLGGYVDVELEGDEIVTVFLVLPAVEASTLESHSSGTALALNDSIERGAEFASGQMRSETMIVNSDRFGVIEVDTNDVLSFPTGIIGFPNDNEFLLIRKTDSEMIAWLQSVRTTYLALPVVSAHVLAPRYPDVSIENFAERAGLGNHLDDLAVLAVLSAPPNLPATVNLMAPIIVNAITRMGAQVLLEGTRFSTRELFVLPPGPVTNDETSTEEAQAVHSATSAAE